MAAFDMVAASAILKTLYPQSEIRKILYKNNPFFAMVKKRTDFYGEAQRVAVRYALTGGRSATFATAQSNKAGSKLAKFQVTRVKDYSLASIDGETIRATSNDKGALIGALENEYDAALWALKRNIAVMLYRSGTGSRGKISAGSNVGTATITLATIQDITNFETGMKLTASAADGGALRSAGATVTITGIDRTLGTLTASGNWTAGIAAVAAGDFLYQQGDEAAGSTNISLAGIQAWAPATAPTSTAFFGLDRTSDVSRLGGLRYAGSGGPIEETLQSAMSLCAREGGDPDSAFLNNADFLNLALALGSKVIYDKNSPSDSPDIGFKSLVMAAPGASGQCNIYADPNCPKGTAIVTQLDTWCFWTLGDIGFLDEDGSGRILREATADSYESRLGYYGQLVCDWPGATVNVTI